MGINTGIQRYIELNPVYGENRESKRMAKHHKRVG